MLNLLFTALLLLLLWTDMTAKGNLQKLAFSEYHGCLACTTPCFAVLWPQSWAYTVYFSRTSMNAECVACRSGTKRLIVKRILFLLVIESRRFVDSCTLSYHGCNGLCACHSMWHDWYYVGLAHLYFSRLCVRQIQKKTMGGGDFAICRNTSVKMLKQAHTEKVWRNSVMSAYTNATREFAFLISSIRAI